MPPQRLNEAGPSRKIKPSSRQCMDEQIGYPSELSPELLLTQPWPEPEINNEPITPLPPKRGRRAVHRNVLVVQQIHDAIATAINSQDNAIALFDQLTTYSTDHMIVLAKANITRNKQLAVVYDLYAHYYIGYGLDLKMDQELLKTEVPPTWSTIGHQYQLTKRQVKLARRVYQLFRLWPDAIGRIKGVTLKDIEKINDEEYQSTVLKLVTDKLIDYANYVIV